MYDCICVYVYIVIYIHVYIYIYMLQSHPTACEVSLPGIGRLAESLSKCRNDVTHVTWSCRWAGITSVCQSGWVSCFIMHIEMSMNIQINLCDFESFCHSDHVSPCLTIFDHVWLLRFGIPCHFAIVCSKLLTPSRWLRSEKAVWQKHRPH